MLSKNSSLHRKAFTRSTRLKFNSKFSDMEQYFKKLTISFISLSFLIKRFPSLLNYQSYSAIWSSQYEPNLNNKNLSKFETSLRNRNPGGGNFQESRISERGLVRAFFADACVGFQLVNIRSPLGLPSPSRLGHALAWKNIVGSGTRSDR